MKKVFINYRRADSSAAAGRLYDRLVEQLGERNVFMDVDDIPPGEDYIHAIQRRIARCDTLIVLIGPQWLGAVNADGKRRLDDPNDMARLEIEAALQRDIRVTPILVDGGEMPDAADLPPSLQSLRRRHAIRLDHESFHKDVELLIEQVGGKIRRKRGTWTLIGLGAVVGVVVIFFLSVWIDSLIGGPEINPPPEESLNGPVEPEPGEPERQQPAASLAGTWYDETGYRYAFWQDQNTVGGAGYDPQGIPTVQFEGTFNGSLLLYEYWDISLISGSGRGDLESDGRHMAITVTAGPLTGQTGRLHYEHAAHY